MHALRRKIGEDAFAHVLRERPAAHPGGNASWPEFEQFVTQVSRADLGGFCNAWFRGDTIPSDADLYPGSLRG